jgi:hypothetical protein
MNNSVRVCETLLQPQTVKIESSKKDKWYNVTSSGLFNDPSCECLGYLHRGRCRHIDEVEDDRCTWVGSVDDPEICPRCGKKTVIYKMEPRRLYTSKERT